jgi:hypothetical protein
VISVGSWCPPDPLETAAVFVAGALVGMLAADLYKRRD